MQYEVLPVEEEKAIREQEQQPRPPVDPFTELRNLERDHATHTARAEAATAAGRTAEASAHQAAAKSLEGRITAERARVPARPPRPRGTPPPPP